MTLKLIELVAKFAEEKSVDVKFLSLEAFYCLREFHSLIERSQVRWN